MRGEAVWAFLTLVAGGATAQAQARQPDTGSADPFSIESVARGGDPSLRTSRAESQPIGNRDYRVTHEGRSDRSAHTRALGEMNALHNLRPRMFRFKPVMAVTFDAADLGGPARMAGIAPSLMGLKRRP